MLFKQFWQLRLFVTIAGRRERFEIEFLLYKLWLLFVINE